jgi:membrane-bound ClpP family serine protease
MEARRESLSRRLPTCLNDMGLLLIVIGIVLAIFVNYLIGIICIVVGILLLFVPGVPYGYSSYRGRRRGPPV